LFVETISFCCTLARTAAEGLARIRLFPAKRGPRRTGEQAAEFPKILRIHQFVIADVVAVAVDAVAVVVVAAAAAAAAVVLAVVIVVVVAVGFVAAVVVIVVVVVVVLFRCSC